MMRNSKNTLKRRTWFDWALYIFFIVLNLLFVYPIWYCIVVSLTSGNVIAHEIPLLWPKEVTLSAYSTIFEGKNIFLYYRNSVFYAVAGTFISLLFTAMMAYPFVVSEFRGKTFFNVFMVITMFFSGGLLPSYFLINAIGWRNTVWVMLIPGAVGAYTVIIFRTFFKGIPSTLREAAFIDGAGHYRILFSLIIPLSKPLLATFGLFGLVGKWNDWFTPNLYFSKDHLMPIQVYLRECLLTTDGLIRQYSSSVMTANNVMSLNLKCSIIIITIAPILCVYPFLQKYFASGMLVGSIKA